MGKKPEKIWSGMRTGPSVRDTRRAGNRGYPASSGLQRHFFKREFHERKHCSSGIGGIKRGIRFFRDTRRVVSRGVSLVWYSIPE
jgi:hypothetical protein